MKKRERLEVINDILSIIANHGNSIKPTPLMRQSNLSSERFAEYLAELLGKGFVREVVARGDRRHLTLTDKGVLYVQRYRAIKNFIDEFDL